MSVIRKPSCFYMHKKMKGLSVYNDRSIVEKRGKYSLVCSRPNFFRLQEEKAVSLSTVSEKSWDGCV